MELLYNERAKSVVYFGPSSADRFCAYLTLQNSNFYHNKGVPIYLSNQNLHISRNIEFYNNSAENGGGIFISDYSNVTFHGSATVNFTHNTANNNGGSIFLINHSSILFKEFPTLYQCHNNELVGSLDGTQSQSLTVIFDNNRVSGSGQDIYAHNNSNIKFGGTVTVMFNENCDSSTVYVNYYSTIAFQGNSIVKINGNNATSNGGVMHINAYSIITFQGHSTVTYNNSAINYYGTIIYIDDYSIVTFQENCQVAFLQNYGNLMYVDHSTITFQGNSKVLFNGNSAHNGHVMYIGDYCTITFQGNSNVEFNDNSVADFGIIHVHEFSTITFEGNSKVAFTNNYANCQGGVIYISGYSAIAFKGNCAISFNRNKIDDYGGSLYIYNNSAVEFKEYSYVTFNDNAANLGGAMHVRDTSTITFEGNSKVSFNNNGANNQGGVIYIFGYSAIVFKGNCAISFDKNKVDDYGGSLYINNNSTAEFKENSYVTFNSNTASLGGVTYVRDSSTITFEGNSKVSFNNNYANNQGGVIYIFGYSAIAFKGNCVICFNRNKADNGGSLYVDNNSTVEFKENSDVMFTGNIADSGGAIVSKSSIILIGNSSVKFIDNIASRDGGAIYLSDQSNFTQLNNSNVTFCNNSASDYGGAVYALLKDSSLNFNSSGIHFKENTARTVQSSVYINILQKAYENDTLILNQSVTIGNNINISLVTSPKSLILYNPAKCIDTNCDTYYINNIMLGQEITFDACVLDYYGQPTEAIQFSITGMDHQHYKIVSQKYISISCNRKTQEISVNGLLALNKLYNYSVNISLYASRASELKIISVNLIVELSPCHPGFEYSSISQKCECYDTKDIISCSGSNSTIKRGYWFGNVSGKPTVTSCPNGYCNFTCCEISNGDYHLSPVRANQCRPHRSGNACGRCKEGYTLSFDSPECVEVDKCTIGAALVTTLSLLYWAAVVVAVFIMTHFNLKLQLDHYMLLYITTV